MGSMALWLDNIGLLPARYRCRYRVLLHSIQDEMHRLCYRAVRRIGESQHPALDEGIIKRTGHIKLDHRYGEVLYTAVSVRVRHRDLHGIGTCGKVIPDGN